MTATFPPKKKLEVYVFFGYILSKSGERIAVRIDSSSDTIHPDLYYDQVFEVKNRDSKPISILGKNIKNISFSHSRPYHTD